jgi:hypothetical protein
MTSSPRSPNRFHGRVPRREACAIPGCPDPGEFRAPASHRISQDGPPQYRWLCLDHIREFNASYDYFAGMNADQIYAAQSPTHGWESESRAFRAAGSADLPPRWADFKDPIDALGARFKQRMAEARTEAQDRAHGIDPEVRRAFSTLELDVGADRRAIRTAYSRLVRKYHPDRNGGDRRHETKLQAVIAAYNYLKS